MTSAPHEDSLQKLDFVVLEELERENLPQERKFSPCPRCGFLISSVAGTLGAICRNCGLKNPCC